MTTILQGDVIERLRELPDASVHCVVTSPPYWNLRDYGVAGQIGLEATVEAWVARLVEVFREVRRVLRDDGTLWLNLGDSYASTPCDGLKAKDLIGQPWRLAFALQADDAASSETMRAVASMRESLLADFDSWDQVPERTRRTIERLDREWEDAHEGAWWLRSDIIWAKPNPMPESVTDRPTKSHEYLFLLTKSPRYFYDAEAIREEGRSGTSDLRKMREQRKRIGGKTLDDEAPLHAANASTNIGQKRSVREPGVRNARTVWTIATQPYPGAHFATFPEELPRRCILAGTSERGVCPECGAPWVRIVETDYVNPGNRSTNGPRSIDHKHAEHGTAGYDVRRERRTNTTGWKSTCDHGAEPVPARVLDPFAGSGTTLAVALRYGRDSIGIELNPEYVALAEQHIAKAERQHGTPLFKEPR